ncbi:putative serine/threonine-protein kinase WNK9 [Dichanthelium oligosanthes]|uniref:non-specific serine/threonine protein kinase n=1 Tax=Dichanthelium oligosanthes TaxID=888268 RepID=A0A1E5V4H4_9POAL|nr:putative serine/threonine-protein kinase WNK9 [Dichanthelium oligosanthes]
MTVLVLLNSDLMNSYKAFDKLEGVEVAWSQSRINDSVMGCSQKMKQLNTEIQLLRTSKHKNIVKLFASWIDEEKGIVNIITEYFTSGSLRQYAPSLLFYFECTLEFMAPELYTGNYNELVDVYAFGMCMLELVTCEYPYSECQGMGHIFKNVSQGKKPAALYKVKDVEVRSFVENCLAPASERLSASELLRSSFLHKDDSLPTPPISVSLVEIENVTKDDDQFDSFVFRKGEFLLQANMEVTNPVHLCLRFPDPYGGFKTVEFPLDVAKDTGLSVAMEMAEQVELPQGSIEIITELIGAFLLVLIRDWRSCITTP